jgi:hypothetical protein
MANRRKRALSPTKDILDSTDSHENYVAESVSEILRPHRLVAAISDYALQLSMMSIERLAGELLILAIEIRSIDEGEWHRVNDRWMEDEDDDFDGDGGDDDIPTHIVSSVSSAKTKERRSRGKA